MYYICLFAQSIKQRHRRSTFINATLEARWLPPSCVIWQTHSEEMNTKRTQSANHVCTETESSYDNNNNFLIIVIMIINDNMQSTTMWAKMIVTTMTNGGRLISYCLLVRSYNTVRDQRIMSHNNNIKINRFESVAYILYKWRKLANLTHIIYEHEHKHILLILLLIIQIASIHLFI